MSETLVRALLAAIEANRHLNAFTTVQPEASLQAARSADRLAAEGRFTGPLHGVPLAVKDNIHVATFPNTAGTRAMQGFRPSAHAPIVQRLVKAGALVLGKTNLHELGLGITSNNPIFGPVRNPYDPSRIAGGSSGGTASAVAARLSPAGLGTDTGGSLRIPAALCGIAALRPTVGRYSQAGITPISRTRDTAGPMARTVRDLVLLDSAIKGIAHQSRAACLRGLRLGFDRQFFANVDEQTAARAGIALGVLRDAGVQIVPVVIPEVFELTARAALGITLYEAARDLSTYLRRFAIARDVKELAFHVASPGVRRALGMVAEHRDFAARAYGPARDARRRLQLAYRDAFARNRLAALAFPTTPLPAPPVGHDDFIELNGEGVPTAPILARNTEPGSIAGIPGISVPIGLTPSGLPVGLALDASPGNDRQVMSIGIALEELLALRPRRR
jgi:mandelamide amidase